MTDFDPARLAAVLSPLRRTLLASTRASANLPDIPDAQIEIVRALPRGVVRSPGELAERLGLGRSTVSNLLTVMTDRGLVTRRPNAHDLRRVEVAATARALALFERFDATSAALMAAAAADLGPAERARLADALPALERLRDILDARRHDGVGDPAAQRRGDPAAQRRGDPAAQRRGDPAAQRRGDPAAQRRGDPAAQRRGDPAAQRRGDPAAQRRGDPAARRRGDPAPHLSRSRKEAE
ncbi:MarR family winged helix-turn-helix transcriptional regulator [Nocardia sp. BMG51109]|uniref:MarR family winged helix-turn-helix transcriptional regulator n=1 Tax=Nocardia sp. BMG51109 TaxID=1056816 RepID=UPI000462FDA3|nr:MarR family winged helix-turn-helix transcriptional regulator [Nocardia sp. BMG51109]